MALDSLEHKMILDLPGFDKTSSQITFTGFCVFNEEEQ